MEPCEKVEAKCQALTEKVIIPPRPEVLVQISIESKKEYPDLSRMAQHIGQDVGLSASVLQVVNSPVFRLARTVTSVQQAVNMLGVTRIERLVTVVSMRSSVSGKLKLDRFWDSATEIANLCGNLAGKLSGSNVDDAYTLGLFHGCGIPLMMQAFPDYKQTLIEVNQTDEYPPTTIEKRRYGVTHTEVGCQLMKRWFLPDYLANAVLLQHQHFNELFDNQDLEGGTLSLMAVLKMAEDISNTFRKAWRKEKADHWEHIRAHVLEYVGIEEEDYQEIKDDLLERLEVEK
jgi:HD-like signal output (HDOD) protein